MLMNRLRYFRLSRFVRLGTLYLILIGVFFLFVYIAGTNQGFTDESLRWLINRTMLINFYLFWFALASLGFTAADWRGQILRLFWYAVVVGAACLSFLVLMALRVWIQ